MIRVLQGDALQVLATLPDKSVHCCVTSPPYWGLRDYGTAEWEGGDEVCDHAAPLRGGITNSNLNAKRDADGNLAPDRKSQPGQSQYRDICGKCGARRVDQQLGLESTPDKYVEALVGVFREVRRVLRDDGTLWLNLGDSYVSVPSGGMQGDGQMAGRRIAQVRDQKAKAAMGAPERPPSVQGLKPKDLVGIPWSVAFALRADGWWLRQDIIWAKPNPMPESVRDRCTKGHEYVFLLAKSERYYYDAEAIKEDFADERMGNPGGGGHYVKEAYTGAVAHDNPQSGLAKGVWNADRAQTGRNRRTVWTIATKPYPEAHFATFPPDLPELCIKASTSEKGACRECGAPWERVVEIESRPNKPPRAGVKYDGDGQHRGMSVGREDRRARADKGWRPTCKCKLPNRIDATPYSPIPCTVLDPFAGAGTTLLVADRLGRNGTGIELNPEYVALIEKRIRDDNPLFADVETA